MHPLPEDRVGDVEPVELDSLGAEVHAQDGQRVFLLPHGRQLQVQPGGPESVRGAVSQLLEKTRLADATDADHVQNPRPFAERVQLLFVGRK